MSVNPMDGVKQVAECRHPETMVCTYCLRARVAELELELALIKGANILLRQEVMDLRRNDPYLNRE